ncbi:DsbA family oxidoreductase [Pseudobdellovibrio exovorus]|uniref:DSBA-like thioredoxin domain-containing protein n=1 Tax=Pseudobdellovibrio exovorus JSS TaxID=1184267 RepID=M4V7Y6_9BACT|nr:DsbA family oxidoreductase [Pseudobdellovibrio exovorus]AGH94545.1 hypothetical protein A11Q_325 [Pseudobdellovibrio exovorus JSS]
MSQTTNQAISQKMQIEIWSDVMCPYCYLGKTKFDTALAQLGKSSDVEIIWKSFQLDPSIPDGKSNQSNYEYVAQKYGWSLERSKQAHAGIVQAGQEVGLVYNFEDMQVANTLKAHRVIKYAQEKGLGSEAEDRFFKAYFTEGKDISDTATLKEIGNSIGLSDQDVEAALSENTYAQAVNSDIQEARALQISGVPFFIFDRKYAVSGAQPPEIFVQVLQQSLAEWSQAQSAGIQDLSTEDAATCKPDGDCD